MIKVAPIRMAVGPKTFWFDPNELDIHEGDSVIVTTKRGQEFGVASSEILEVSDELIENLSSPLQKVIRIATPEDLEKQCELEQRGKEAMPIYTQFVEESGLDIHPVMVEFLFDGDKGVFYFESEERVDFRELVHLLAGEFHVRVDMRQIGVRDSARMIGGIGHCGQELCCRRMSGEFSPVSIRMAKEQGLSLNQQKISGCCGRLMCCLRYEYETYKEFNSRAPRMGARIDTPEGEARVVDINVPKEEIVIRNEDGKNIRIPLADFDEPEEGRRPHCVSEEVYERCLNPEPPAFAPSALFEAPGFAGTDKLAQPGMRAGMLSGEEPINSAQNESNSEKSEGRSRRRRGADSSESKEKDTQRRGGQRKRRSRSQERTSGNANKDTSSAIDEVSAGSHGRRGSENANDMVTSGRTQHRRRRRGSTSIGVASTDATINHDQSARRQDGGKETSGHHSRREHSNQKASLRPGHRSSGLNAVSSSDAKSRTDRANKTNRSSGDAQAHSRANHTGQEKRSTAHRKPRCRTHTAGVKNEGEAHENE